MSLSVSRHQAEARPPKQNQRRGGKSCRRLQAEPSVSFCLAVLSEDGRLAAAVDTHGGLYVFDLCVEGFCSPGTLALREAPAAGALCFARAKGRDEILYAVGNRVRVVDACTCLLVKSLLGHERRVHGAVSAGELAVTRSIDVVFLWSTADWTRAHTLCCGASPSPPLVTLELTCRGDAVGALYSDARVIVWATTSCLPQMELQSPLVDGSPLELSLLAMGDRYVVAATADSKRMMLVIWPVGAMPVVSYVVAETAGPILQLLLREAPQDLSLVGGTQGNDVAACNDLLFLVHADRVCVVGAESRHVLRVLQRPEITYLAVDGRGSHALLLNCWGEIELHHITAVKRAAHRRQGTMRIGATQPLQGPRRLLLVSPSRLRLAAHLEDSRGHRRQAHGELAATRRSLVALLSRHGTFPKTHRSRIWSLLLQLPRNAKAHAKLPLAALGTGGLWETELLRTLVAWAPALAEVHYLPAAVSWFSEVFAADAILAFEACATFLLNWAGHWLDLFPDPPLDLLTRARALLMLVDPKLCMHLEACCAVDAAGVSMLHTVFWPIVSTALSECLPKDAWFALWDHLVARWREPELLGVAAVALLRHLRGTLLALPALDGAAAIGNVLRQPQTVLIPALVEELYVLCDVARGDCTFKTAAATPTEKQRRPAPLPLPASGAYPALLDRPHYVLDHLVEDRSRARAELEIARVDAETGRELNEAIEALALQEEEEQRWRADLLRAESTRRSLAREDDEKQEAEWRHVADKAFAARLQHMDLACRTMEGSLSQQSALHEAEYKRLADEMLRRRRRASLRKEASERKLELAITEEQVAGQLWELSLRCRAEEASRELREDVRAELLRREHYDEAEARRMHADLECERTRGRERLHREIEAHQLEMASQHKLEVGTQLALDEHVRRLQFGRVAAERSVRRAVRDAAAEAELELKRRRQQHDDGAQLAVQRSGSLVRKVRRRWGRHLQSCQQALDDERSRAQRSLMEQEQRLEAVVRGEEQARFEEGLGRICAADEAVAAESDEALRRAIAILERTRLSSERDEALLEQRRELSTLQGRQRLRAQQLATDLLFEDRELFCEELGRCLPPETMDLRRHHRPVGHGSMESDVGLVLPMTPQMVSSQGSETDEEIRSSCIAARELATRGDDDGGGADGGGIVVVDPSDAEFNDFALVPPLGRTCSSPSTSSS